MAIKLVEFHDPLNTTKDKNLSIEFVRKPISTPKKNRHNLIILPHKNTHRPQLGEHHQHKIKKNRASQDENIFIAIAYSAMRKGEKNGSILYFSASH